MSDIQSNSMMMYYTNIVHLNFTSQTKWKSSINLRQYDNCLKYTKSYSCTLQVLLLYTQYVENFVIH